MIPEAVIRRRPDNAVAKRKKTNNNLQITTEKTKDRAARTPLKPGGVLMCSGRISSSCSIYDTCRVTFATNTVIYKSWIRKGPDCDYDKWNISVVICATVFHTDQPSHDGNRIPYRSTKSWWQPYSIPINQVMMATVFHTDQPSHDGHRQTFEVATSTC
jgi:hypothetical protein